MVLRGFLGVLVGFLGVLMGACGCLWVLMGSYGFYGFYGLKVQGLGLPLGG